MEEKPESIRDVKQTQGTSKAATLTIAVLASFLTPFMVSAINIALPSISKEFRPDAVSLSWVATAYLLASAVFLLPFGRIADIYGRKRVFTIGIIVYTLSAILAALSPSMAVLITARVIEGVGSAMIFGTSMAILIEVFPREQRGTVLGINVAAVYIGLSIGPFIGGFLTQQFGWRSIFLWNIPIGIAVLLLLVFKLKGEWAEAAGEKVDYLGSLIYGAALISAIYGLSRLPSALGFALIIIGVVLSGVFLFWESRVASPVLDVSLFEKNKVFVMSNLAALINYSATSAVGFLLSLFLQYIKGYPPQQAGLILLAQPVVQAAFSPVAGKVSDTIEPRIVATAGMAVTTIGLVLFAFLDKQTSVATMVLGLVLLGFGFALFSSPNTNAVMSSVEKRLLGVASGVLGTMRLTGQMLSLGIVTMLFAVVIGAVQITPKYYPAFITSAKTGFIIFAVLCFAGVFASLTRGKLREKG